ncbi:MAG: polysaccharide biosynthesis C-terminal domain-containing protein [bacterium]
MIGSTASVARQTLAYATGSVVGGISRAVLLFVIARRLAPEDFGVLSLLLATTNFLHLVFEAGLVTALIRAHHRTENEDERRRLRVAIFRALPALDLLLLIPVLIAREGISQILFGTPAHGGGVAIAAGIAFFAAQFQLYLGHLRALDRARDFAWMMAAKGVISLSVTLYLVFGRGLGIEGFLLGNLAGPATIALVAIPRLLLRARGAGGGAPPRLRPLLAFGLPLVPSALGLWALSYLDGWLLRVFADLHAVGVYSFASEICLPLALLVTSIQLAWPSFSFSRPRDRDGAEGIARVYRHLFVVVAGGGLAIAVLRREVLVVLSAQAFDASVRVIPWLVLATVLYAASQAFSTGLQIAGDTRRLPFLVGAAALTNAGLNAWMIPIWRESGAAIATVITNVLLCALVLLESHRQYRVPFEVFRLGRTLLAAGAVFAAGELVGDVSFPAGLAIRVPLLALFPLLLLPFRAVAPQELARLPSVVAQVARRAA